MARFKEGLTKELRAYQREHRRQMPPKVLDKIVARLIGRYQLDDGDGFDSVQVEQHPHGCTIYADTYDSSPQYHPGDVTYNQSGQSFQIADETIE